MQRHKRSLPVVNTCKHVHEQHNKAASLPAVSTELPRSPRMFKSLITVRENTFLQPAQQGAEASCVSEIMQSAFKALEGHRLT